MKITRKIKGFFGKFTGLDTIESKSFWIVAPTIAIIGFLSFIASLNYNNILAPLVLSMVCIVAPAILMIVVTKRKNYHSAYPILCICVGAISAPLIFAFNGGYLSGNMLFCALGTGLTALCYVPKYRWISLGLCVLGNIAAFVYVYYNGSPFPLSGVSELLEALKGSQYSSLNITFNKATKDIFLDQLFAYFCCSLGLFLVLNWVTSDIRKYKLNTDTLQQYFDIEKRKEIFQNAIGAEKGKKTNHKKAVILFADISNFTSTTEKMNSDLVSDFLNEFFTIAGKYIHKTGGIIDKYIGDCIMAYWLDREDENSVLNAVESMIHLKQEIFHRSEDIYQKYGIEMNFSVGIAYGDVIFGDIGSDTMHDFTIIGDAVNTASRIQDYATSGEILISDEAAEKVKEAVILSKVEDDHFFKGKNNAIDLYRVTGISTSKNENDIKVKNNFDYELTVCGCRGSFPVSGLRFSEYGGETSCYLIKKDDYACIIDCGTGLKNAVESLGNCKKIDILLTHVHYDHILGFLMSKFPTNVDVRIFGRFDKWNKSASGLVGFMEHPYWPIELISSNKVTVNLEEEIKLENGIRATFYQSDHPDDACVIKVMCGDKKVAFLADCEDATKIDPSVAKDSELVFFDGMFDDTDTVNHKGWGHGTWQDGVKFVKGRNIKKLIITHHNPELGDHSLMLKENKAREMEQNVSFAKTGDIFKF